MAASNTDKITDTRNAARPNSARVTSGRSAAGATLACDNLSGWPTASKVHFVTYTVDSSSNPVAGTQLDCYGIVSGNSLTSFTVVDGTDTGNSIGDYVEMLPTAAWGQDLADAMTSQHSRIGAHKNVTNTGGMTTDTLTVTSGSTLPAGDIVTADLAAASVTASKLSTGAAAAAVTTSQSTNSVTFTDLATVGPSVTVTIGSNGLALVIIAAKVSNGTNTGQSFAGYTISGANTKAASLDRAVAIQPPSAASAYLQASYSVLETGLAAGSTTFTMQYRTDGNSGSFENRAITVIPL